MPARMGERRIEMKVEDSNQITVPEPRRTLVVVVLSLAMGLLFAGQINAVVVQTANRTINNGRADFGSGNHSFGGPSGAATITFDWSPNAGLIRSTGRVRGTLYWDSLFSSGCARLTIRFRNSSNTTLDTRTIDECGTGGDANNASNRTPVDVSFASVNLANILLTTSEVVNNTEVGAASAPVITQVTQKVYSVKVENGAADFGDGNHSFGSPDEPGQIFFRRNANGTMTSIVNGILYWDSSNNDGCSELHLFRRTINGGILDDPSFLNCGPGGNANSQSNQLFVFQDTFTGGTVFDLVMEVFDSAFPADGEILTFGYAGQVGDFEVEPPDATVEVNQSFSYPLMWTVPEPLNWHDLNTMELQIRDGATTILRLRYEEQGNLISVFNEATGRYGKASPIGSNKKLQTPYATVDLAETTVGPVNNAIGFGPNSPTIRLGLALLFKPSAAGRTYSVEVAATDDLGNSDPFALAGTVAVE